MSKLGTVLLSIVVVTAAFFACGGQNNPGGTVCAKEAECAKAKAQEFSLSKCEQDALYDFEDADSIGCGSQWKAIYDCAATLDCSAADDTSKFDSQCGDTVKTLDTCVKNAKGQDAGTPGQVDVG